MAGVRIQIHFLKGKLFSVFEAVSVNAPEPGLQPYPHFLRNKQKLILKKFKYDSYLCSYQCQA